MCLYRDMDHVRAKLAEDIRAVRSRGRVSPLVRATAWALLVTGAWLLGAPWAALPAILVFEAYLAPLFARRCRELGPLGEWRPPEGYAESPEALARPGIRR